MRTMEIVKHLIKQMFRKTKGNAFKRNCDLATLLDAYSYVCGSKVADAILTELFKRKKAGKLLVGDETAGAPLFHLSGIAAKFAQPKHDRKLVKMLFWDENFPRKLPRLFGSSDTHILMNALSKIGTPRIIPRLGEYAARLKEVGREDEWDYCGGPTVEAIIARHQQGT